MPTDHLNRSQNLRHYHRDGPQRFLHQFHILHLIEFRSVMRRSKDFIIVCLGIVACVAWWKYLDIRIRAALAEEQTQFFDEIVQQAAQRKTAEEIAADIEAVTIYGSSGFLVGNWRA